MRRAALIHIIILNKDESRKPAKNHLLLAPSEEVVACYKQ
jgi:hypothetical protein